MITLRYFILAALLGCSAIANASLVGIEDDVVLAGYDEVDDVVVAISTNPVTNEYATCYATVAIVASEIICRRFDSNDQLLSEFTVENDTLPDYEVVDLALTDTGEVYVFYTGADNTNISIADDRAFVQAFDTSGQPLFDVVQTANTDWIDTSFALGASTFWVTGAVISDFIGISIVAEYFSLDGTVIDTRTIASDLPNIFLSDCSDIIVDVVSNRSGDLVVTWMEPNEELILATLIDDCSGSIFAQSYRESGGVISDVTQLSSTITVTVTDDDTGDTATFDASNYRNPQAIAYENGNYVIVWSDAAETYTASMDVSGNLTNDQEVLLDGLNPAIGGNSANQDYIAISAIEDLATCVLLARLAFGANSDPEVVFSPGDCGFDYDVDFQSDGRALLIRTSTQTDTGNIIVNRINAPAEIEVSSSTILEGDPARGQGGVASVEVSLTRPHPEGDQIQVSYFTRDNTALVGFDYVLTQGTLTFPGDGSLLAQSVQIPILPDAELEDNELFDIVIENPINAVIKNGGDTGTVLITDDDVTPDIFAFCTTGGDGFCPDNVDEPAPDEAIELLVTLTMEEAIERIVTVNFETADGTATAGEDYVATSGSVQFLPGSTQATIVLTVLGDTINENTETFSLELSGDSTLSLIESSLIFSIINENLCNLSIEPVPNEVVTTAEGGPETFDVVSTLSTCDWNISTDVDWITLTNPNTGSGTGSVTVGFDVAAFDPAPEDPQARNGSITVTLVDPLVTQEPLIFEVGQDGDCDFTLSMDSDGFPVDGGTGSFTVTPSDPTCEWSGTSDVDWVTITAPLQIATGTGDLEFTVSDNAGDINVENPMRSFTLISEEFDFTINQDGCSYGLDQSSIDVDAAEDDNVQVNVLAPTAASGACAWTAVSNSSWILVTDGASGSGGATVTLAILDNPSVEARTGSVSIGDEVLMVNQSGQACEYGLDPVELNICPDGDTFELDVTATDGCSWSLDSVVDWATVLTNESGIGSETATGLFSSNLSEMNRFGGIELQVTADSETVAELVFVQDGFLIYEPFESGLPGDWLFDPAANWSTSANQLVANQLGAGMGSAIDISNSCTDCKIETTATVTTASNSSMDVLTLIGWYRNDDNYVGLAMDEFANTWRLIQLTGGTETSAEMVVDSILPNVAYDLALKYDGIDFIGEVDGIEVVRLPVAFTNPVGNTGVTVNANNAQFSELRVTGNASGFEDLLIDGFENNTQALSICTQ